MELNDLLESGARQYGIDLNEEKIDQFVKYMNILREWNEKINLTAITDKEEIIKKHFIDSLSLIKSNVLSKNISLIDVGTGAGFPGIPIKIVFPEIRVLLLDSLGKRVKFLNTVIAELGLKNITAIHGRAEEVSKQKMYREMFDISTARAVANLAVLSEYCLPFVKKNGYFIAMKGPSGYDELDECKDTFKELGGELKEIIQTEILDEDIKHNIIIVKKIEKTPEKYPRRFAIIEKNPLK